MLTISQPIVLQPYSSSKQLSFSTEKNRPQKTSEDPDHAHMNWIYPIQIQPDPLINLFCPFDRRLLFYD